MILSEKLAKIQENRCQNLDFEVFRARFQILSKGFESSISNFKQGFWEPDFKIRERFSEPDF